MKKAHMILLLSMSIAVMLSYGCGKKAEVSTNTSQPPTINTGSTIEVVPVPNHNVKTVDLGIADSFAIMAYISITSAPSSKITGKVGLKPGTRSSIMMNPQTEVAGGLSEVYAGDDEGDPSDYLTIAREDLIAAYRDAVARPADKDKVEAYAGKPGGKILPPGIYKWSNGVSIDSDITLEGDSTDVFIFQVDGDMSVAPNVQIHLSGGIRSKYIFWQVSGRVTLDTGSSVPGTIMSQLTFEMKSQARLQGRALVKNGKLLLNQNVITKPGL